MNEVAETVQKVGESNTKIQYTKEYGLFHFLKGNRDLNEAKIEKIIKSVKSGLNFFKYCPILINEDRYIIDGQHRFWACKKLGLPVYFVVVPQFSLRQIAEINNNTSKWKIKDFMNCYIDANVNRDQYKILERISSEHKLNISLCINLLMYGKVGGGGMSDAFRNGEFKVNFMDFTERLISQARQFEQFEADWKSRSFLQAIEKLQSSDKYDQDAVIKKLTKHSLVIAPQSSSKEYLSHIESLFNFKNSIRQPIY
jgi:hypothetical protein